MFLSIAFYPDCQEAIKFPKRILTAKKKGKKRAVL